MSTQSNQSNNEIKNEKLVEEKEDKVWCECGEHFCNRDEHWVSVYPNVEDCFECCSEKECKELLEEDDDDSDSESEFDLEVRHRHVALLVQIDADRDGAAEKVRK